ncbi:ragulator complex protein LAMTOR5 homolog [Clytia hemisphaerica]|uniref:ragulator complex protein LAMTOR5 homolog n=1 Tax=Clytia hemisphaerica TaxID=252671 RepID=UPI0034D5A7AD
MEKNLALQLEDIMNESNVTGVICCDLNGLMLAVRGVATSEHAGAVSSIASQASKLFPANSEDSPIICLESDKSNLLIRKQDKVVVGIFKNKI